MRRLFFAALVAALPVFAACSGGSSDKKAEASPSAAPSGAADQGAIPTVDPATPQNEQPQVPDKALPTPTPIPDDTPVLQVVAAGKAYTPLRSQFSELPKTTVEAGGKKYDGVTLAALAGQAGAAEGALATIQGTRTDNLRLGAIRFSLREVGANTVLFLDEGGHVDLASSSIPADQWLNDVTGIAFN